LRAASRISEMAYPMLQPRSSRGAPSPPGAARDERFGYDRPSGRARVERGGVPELLGGFDISGGEPFGG
jgi:hypothetical protein